MAYEITDVDCPYCDHGFNIHFEGTYEWDEECPKCGKEMTIRAE